MSDRAASVLSDAKRLVRAVTPPIVLTALKKVLSRLGLRNQNPVGARGEPGQSESVAPGVSEHDASPIAPPPSWEYVPEGWKRPAKGWDGGTVADAYLAKWPEWVDALSGPAPLGVYHEAPTGVAIAREDMSAHNMLLSFAYVLARTAHGKERLSVLDWGGGLGHYAILARAVLPEVRLEWHCREVPSVADAGRSVNADVTFHTDDMCLERAYDLVFASGSLQYEVDWPALFRRFAQATAGFLFITRLPVALRSPSFVVLQRADAYGYSTEYLGWVISRRELLAAASSAKLDFERELLLDAWLPPIGGPEEPIGHRGFLFHPTQQS